MLDQNTDRMWYVIGAIVIGAAIIAMGLNIFDNSFESVEDNFATLMRKVNIVDEQVINENNLIQSSDFEKGYFNFHTGAKTSASNPHHDMFERTVNSVSVKDISELYFSHGLTVNSTASPGIEVAWHFRDVNRNSMDGANSYDRYGYIDVPEGAYYIDFRFGLNVLNFDNREYVLIDAGLLN